MQQKHTIGDKDIKHGSLVKHLKVFRLKSTFLCQCRPELDAVIDGNRCQAKAINHGKKVVVVHSIPEGLLLI